MWVVAHGEAGSVDVVVADEERVRMSKLLDGQDLKNVYNFDETSLFWRQVPTRGYALGTFQGGKQEKTRISLGFCCNADGSDKRLITYVDVSAKPRAFVGKSPRDSGFQYWNNKKAWFNNRIMIDWLREFDNDMRKQERHIILLMDNFSAHIKALEAFTPTNITPIFFAPNLTSHVQPLDQGIIRAFKGLYQLRKTRHTVGRLDSSTAKPWELSIREAMSFAKESWDSVKPSTCVNCFRHAGILLGQPDAGKAAVTVSGAQTSAKDPPTADTTHNAAWAIILGAFDMERSIPVILKVLKRALGPAYNAEEWTHAVNLTCYEVDETRDAKKTAAENLKRDRVGIRDAAPARADVQAGNAKPAAETSISIDTDLAELEAALALASLQTGCTPGKELSCVTQLLNEVSEVEAETQIELQADEEEQLMEDIIKRIEHEGVEVTEVSDGEEEDDIIDPEISRYAGDLTDSLLLEINSALQLLLNLGTARPEEDFAQALVPNMQAIKKWSQHMHFELPREQASITKYFQGFPRER